MGDITNKIGSGKTPKGGSSVYVNFGIPILRSQNIYENRVNFDDVVYITKEIDEHMSNSRVLKKDILLNITGASIGRSAVYLCDQKANVNQHVCIIRPNLKTNSSFVQLNIASPKGQKQIDLNQAGGGREGLNFRQISNMSFFYPKIEEQIKIENLFTSLNDILTLHQRKLDLLKRMKQGFMQVMFPQQGESVPRLRFADFDGIWEQRKLNNYLETSRTKNNNELYTKLDVLSVSGDFGIINQIEFQGRSFAGASVATYGIVEKENIVYTKSPLKSNPYGIIKVNKGKPGIVSTLYAIYKAKSNTNPNFVEYYFANNLRLNKYLKPLVNKGAKNDMKVSDDNALIGNVIFPVNFEEQVRIAEYFKKIDDTITLHQQKIKKMQSIKKAFLQKMFV